jgi:Pyruvate/2-oxoacid:ferredoxin oxidoreductase delta subunit
MSDQARILFCNCSYARVVPHAVKAEVLDRLSRSGVDFEAVPDLCEMSARRDPRLAEIAGNGSVRIAACYPRAVKWLFAAAGSPLRDDLVQIRNMRTETAEAVADALTEEIPKAAVPLPSPEPAALDAKPGSWRPWFPVIDYQRCTNCMQCLSFCLFEVYGVSDGKITVQNQTNCKTDCPACSRVCPEVAIMFPKYRHGPINGEEVNNDDIRREAMKVDISALLGGDIYSTLRDRSAKAKSRFSKERDDDRALKERQACLTKLAKEIGALDIPPEVLSSLPSADQIRARADAARYRAEQARAAAVES